MKSNVPWSIKGITPDARVAAKRAAKDAGMTLGEWLNNQIMFFDPDIPEETTQQDASPRQPNQESVQTLPANVVTLDQLRELVYSLNRLNERLKTSERDSRQALSGLNQGLTSTMERLRGVEQARTHSNEDAMLLRLEKIEAEQNTSDGQDRSRIDSLLNLEKALSQMVEQFDQHQRDTMDRVQVNEEAISSLSGQFAHLDNHVLATISTLKQDIDKATAQLHKTEKTARAVMLEARAASHSTDDEFIERTGNKLRILGTEIKRSGDHIQGLEGQIGKLSDHIEGAEQRSAAGIGKVAATIETLREELTHFDHNQGALTQEAQGIISSVTREADERISSLQNSFDKMVARLEGPTTEEKSVDPDDLPPHEPSTNHDEVLNELFEETLIVDQHTPDPLMPDPLESSQDATEATAPPKARKQLTPRQKVLLARRARQKRLAAEAEASPTPEAITSPPPPLDALTAAAPQTTDTTQKNGAFPDDLEEQLKAPPPKPDGQEQKNAINANLSRLKEKYNRTGKSKGLPLVPLLSGLGLVLLAGLVWFVLQGESGTSSAIQNNPTTQPQPGAQSTESPATANPTPAPNNQGSTVEAQYQRWKAMSARATTPEEQSRALTVLKRAASRNYPPAQFALGEAYRTGTAAPNNPQLARQWLQSAAEGGNVEAMHKLGAIYASGSGGEQDIFTAISWFEQAAAHGMVNSIYNLALLYDPGTELEGIEVDVSDAGSAYYWYRLAAKLGDPDGSADAEIVGQRITPEKRRQLNQRLETWTPVPPIASANIK